MTEKRYMINVDFANKSRVHLNPLYFNDMWCQLNEEKKRLDGGKVYVTNEEARKYLNGEKTLLFDQRLVKNLVECKNCSERSRQSKFWDI